MAKISKIWAREILDSRGIPTVEAICQLDTGQVSVASVPSGTSTGTYEALELRDNDSSRFLGKGVLKAVSNVNDVLGPGIWGMEATNQKSIDERLISLDGTNNKSKYGANAILAVSIANMKAAAMAAGKPLYSWINKFAKGMGLKEEIKVPTPVLVLIEGGLHGAGNLDFQEFCLIPATSKKYSDALRAGVEIFLALGKGLERRGAIHSFGQEGGYAPNLFTNADAVAVLVESTKETNYHLGRDVFIGLDVAANSFFKNGEYAIRDKSSTLKDDKMLEYYQNLNEEYRLAYLEDPFHEDAWDSWKKLFESMSDELIIVGDDLLTSNPVRVQKAIQEKACNGLLVKPNQVGTVTETLQVVKLARDANWKIITSHRGGETNDWFIADFAVGIASDYAKFGAPSRGERVAKYNRLLSIEAELQETQQ